ncbi:MAG: two-component regulator propeller domain-containing protein, partial [Bacteroidota bacterium]
MKINHIHQCKSGFIWGIGPSGLHRYDGVNWRNIPGLQERNQEISALFEDQSGHLWLGMAGGDILEFTSDSLQLVVKGPEMVSSKTSNLLRDQQKTWWLATSGDGLWFYAGEQWKQLDGMPDDYIYDLYLDAAGHIWAATDRGIAIIHPAEDNQISLLGRAQGLPDEIVRVLEADVNGQVWLGMYEGGVCRFDENSQRFTDVFLPGNKPINDLFFQGKTLFIATGGNGLWEKKADARARPLQTEKREKVIDILIDSEANLWKLTQPQHLSTANLRFRFLPIKGEQVLGVHAGQSGQIHAYDQDSLYVFQPQTRIWRSWQLPSPRKITALYEDAAGGTWLGTLGGGVWYRATNTENWLHITEELGLSSNHVISISGTAEKIWFATFGGASSCDLPRFGRMPSFRHFGRQDGLGIEYIYQVMMGQDHKVWFATDGKGIRYWNGEEIKDLQALDGQTFLSMARAEQGHLWFASMDSGIYQYQGGQLQNLSYLRGLQKRK